MSGLTLITPTNGRPEALRLCQMWIERQRYEGPIQWLVQEGDKPQGEHLLDAIPNVKHDKVVIIEDDDWYSSRHLISMDRALEDYAIAGEEATRHYHLSHRCFRQFRTNGYASLFRTAFRSDLLARFDASCRKGTAIDMAFWRSVPEVHQNRQPEPFTAIGIKGMPGTPGLGKLHNAISGTTPDPDLKVFRDWLGADAEAYLPFMV